MLDRNHTLLVVVDVQDRMMAAIDGHDVVLDNVVRLVKGLRRLDIPMLVTEQYPNGLGATVTAVSEAMGEWYRPVEKMSFSACGEMLFMNQLETAGRQNVLVVGVETHVCVYQTARDVRTLGYDVQVVADAVGSRTASNKEIALRRMERLGIGITSVELALFEIMDRADIPEFKDVQAIIK